MQSHNQNPKRKFEVLWDLSPTFINSAGGGLTRSWNRDRRIFSCAASREVTLGLGAVGTDEGDDKPLREPLRWAVPKWGNIEYRAANQHDALPQILKQGLKTWAARRIKINLWIAIAYKRPAVAWQSITTRRLQGGQAFIGDFAQLAPIRFALKTLSRLTKRVVSQWRSAATYARINALNVLFAMDYIRSQFFRSTKIGTSLAYLIAAPAASALRPI